MQVSDFAGPITELTFQRNQTNPELKRRRRVCRNSYKGPMDNNKGGGGWGKRAENCTWITIKLGKKKKRETQIPVERYRKQRLLEGQRAQDAGGKNPASKLLSTSGQGQAGRSAWSPSRLQIQIHLLAGLFSRKPDRSSQKKEGCWENGLREEDSGCCGRGRSYKRTTLQCPQWGKKLECVGKQVAKTLIEAPFETLGTIITERKRGGFLSLRGLHLFGKYP